MSGLDSHNLQGFYSLNILKWKEGTKEGRRGGREENRKERRIEGRREDRKEIIDLAWFSMTFGLYRGTGNMNSTYT